MAIFNTRRWLMSSLITLIVLSVIALLFMAQPVLTGVMTWGDALKLTFLMWAIWGVLAPLIVELAFHFPLERSRLPVSLVVHLVAFTAIFLIKQSVATHVMENFNFVHQEGGGPLPEAEEKMKHDGPPIAVRILIDGLIYSMVVSVCQTVAWSRRAHERELRALTAEAHLATARLEVLRMQLNPHFLFNALNGISTLVHTDPRTADDMIANLSQLLRLSLDSSDEQEIPLRRELDFLQCYLDIEKARFGDRLRIEREIAPETLTAFVPPLLLQPLIENALRHGLGSETGPGLIRLSVRLQEGTLHIEVSDNGRGLRDADESTGGIGLTNTRARLHELYGARHRLVLRNGDLGGCTVEIEIPCRTH
jgi:two-component system LytT family sensor kinase